MLDLAQDSLERAFRSDHPTALRAIVAPVDAAQRYAGACARAVVYDVATHPMLADCIDVAAMDVWALHGAFERVVCAWRAPVGADARIRRVRHACQMAGAFAAALPTWWYPNTRHAPEVADMLGRASAWVEGAALAPRAFAQGWLAALVINLPHVALRREALTHLEAQGTFGQTLARFACIDQKLAQLHAWFVGTASRGVAMPQAHRDDLLALADALSANKTPCLPRVRYEALRASVAYALGTLGVGGTQAWLTHHADMPLEGLRQGWIRLGGDAARAQAAIWREQPARVAVLGHAAWLVDASVPDAIAQLAVLWHQSPHWRGWQTNVRSEIFVQVLRLRQPALIGEYVNLVVQAWDPLLQARAAQAAADAGLHAEALRLATAACGLEPLETPLTARARQEMIASLMRAVQASPLLAPAVGTLVLQCLHEDPLNGVRARLYDTLQSLDTPQVNQYLLATSLDMAHPHRSHARHALLRSPHSIDCSALVRHLLRAPSPKTGALPALSWLLRQGDLAAAKPLLRSLLAQDDVTAAHCLREMARAFSQPGLGKPARALAAQCVDSTLACLDVEPLDPASRQHRAQAAVATLSALFGHVDAALQARITDELADIARDRAFYPADATSDAIAALGRLDTPRALSALLDIGQAPRICDRVCQAIAGMVACADLVAQPMVAWASHPTAEVRGAALTAVARLQPGAHAGLFWHGMTDAAWPVRAAAAGGLATLGDPDAHVTALRALLEDPILVQQAASWHRILPLHPRMRRTLALQFDIPTGWEAAQEPGYLLEDASAVRASLNRVANHGSGGRRESEQARQSTPTY